MTRTGAHADDIDDVSADRNWQFWVTLVVTTLLVAVTVYVLSAAFLDPGAKAPARHTAAIMHARS
jgi:hypothetical protein